MADLFEIAERVKASDPRYKDVYFEERRVGELWFDTSREGLLPRTPDLEIISLTRRGGYIVQLSWNAEEGMKTEYQSPADAIKAAFEIAILSEREIRKLFEQHAVHGNPIEFVDQGLSPLCDAAAPRGTDPRNIYHRAYEVFRAALVDPDVPLKPNEPYFAQTTQTMLTSPTTGRTFKKPRKTILPGAKPGTIAFVDYHPTSMAPMTSLYIDYVRVRSDMSHQGVGYRMIQAFYEAFAARGVTYINWGRVMNTHAWRLLERMQAEYPSIESSGKRQF